MTAVVLSLVVGWGIFLSQTSSNGLVVYCAHDAVYSEAVLRRFEQQTGIPVTIRFDTEATKSLSLVRMLLDEKDHPRCDVFWNNEQLGTMELQRAGALVAYKGSGFTRIPAPFKDPSGHWVGFAARFRVQIINTKCEPPPEFGELPEGLLDRVAIAKPLFGTTLTHYVRLWQEFGPEALKDWQRHALKQKLHLVPGNGRVMSLVADGICDYGWTDTDDFYVALDDGKPVRMLPVRVQGKTIAIPNTVAIIRGTRKLTEAQKLVDFLLSEETELALARSKSRQVPLGPVTAALPADVDLMLPWLKTASDLSPLFEFREPCLRWLESENLP